MMPFRQKSILNCSKRSSNLRELGLRALTTPALLLLVKKIIESLNESRESLEDLRVGIESSLEGDELFKFAASCPNLTKLYIDLWSEQEELQLIVQPPVIFILSLSFLESVIIYFEG